MRTSLDISAFRDAVDTARRASDRTLMVPLSVRLMGDQLTPVIAYRRLVAQDERTAPSFLFESVEGGERVGRHSLLGANPRLEIVARGHDVSVTDRRAGDAAVETTRVDDPMGLLTSWSRRFELVDAGDHALPPALLGGWVGYASYDTVRYAEPERLPFDGAPGDDRALPDLHFGLYDETVVFDHVAKIVHATALAHVAPGDDVEGAFRDAHERLVRLVDRLEDHGARPLRSGRADSTATPGTVTSNLTREQHAQMIERAKSYIRAGDIFQVVLGQRFERTSHADPFEVYRALRVVNPSPYMVYLQARGCILVASSPEILCRVRLDEAGAPIVTNRPLAGTRRRSSDDAEDRLLEEELLADEKERAEHVMLVDLGRNDVGRVASPDSVRLERVMEVERYSHVMHISSTVTGRLRDGLDAWDALRSTLPVGTISGAPKVRAMQIIDELEPLRRGPYGGGFGWVALTGEMDIALALRTMVVPTGNWTAGASWTYHLQASGGIVYDSQPEAEYAETQNKAAALVRAIDLAEAAFA
ncbi:MAG: anthranilate synthase component I [Phycisphaerales bacterium]